MSAFELAEELGHEEVLIAQDPEAGLRVVIAIHNTTLGPAVGGTRMRLYESFDAAVVDALRLSRAMTYKAVLADVPRGGGKAVIYGDPARDKTRDLLLAYARLLDRLDGRFHTGPDMGIDGRDAAVLARQTKHVTHSRPDSTVDSSDLTALGVLESIRATAGFLDKEMDGLHVALQGLGQVGLPLARRLEAEGVRLTLADVDAGRVDRATAEMQCDRVEPDEIYAVEADVFCPAAAGAIINDDTLPRLAARAIVGAANEQLAEPRHGDALHERGIAYAPDYVVNAGGLISLLFEIGETDEDGVTERVRGIGIRVAEILARAKEEDIPPARWADKLVEKRLEAVRAERRESRYNKAPDGWQPAVETWGPTDEDEDE